ncbi:MAG: hypothetical protein R3321_13420, partial [Nitrososphaeraceae archaeon]|nr:hypothetical protein [Nitrososphaeraceae archaeon]
MIQTNTSQSSSKRILSYTGGWLKSYSIPKTFSTEFVKVCYQEPNIYTIQQNIGPICIWTFYDSILIDYTIELGSLK